MERTYNVKTAWYLFAFKLLGTQLGNRLRDSNTSDRIGAEHLVG